MKEHDTIYYSNNYGPFKIIREAKIPGYNRKAVEIEFINTGTREIVKWYQAKKGRVKDVYLPKLYGVACIGHETCYHVAHSLWNNMISRCYNPNDHSYTEYGAKGVRVCNRWLCFEYFVQDLPLIDGYNKWISNRSMYHLDKDYKQQGVPYNKRVYSLETCCFISRFDNVIMSNSNNKYMGLEAMPSGRVRVRPRIDGRRECIGVFENEVAAANAYNNYIKFYLGNIRTVLNDVEYMSPSEVMKYNLKPRTMCKIIDDK